MTREKERRKSVGLEFYCTLPYRHRKSDDLIVISQFHLEHPSIRVEFRYCIRPPYNYTCLHFLLFLSPVSPYPISNQGNGFSKSLSPSPLLLPSVAPPFSAREKKRTTSIPFLSLPPSIFTLPGLKRMRVRVYSTVGPSLLSLCIVPRVMYRTEFAGHHSPTYS